MRHDVPEYASLLYWPLIAVLAVLKVNLVLYRNYVDCIAR